MTQTDLAHFRDEELLALARNPAAQTRQDAIKLLVERGSQLATHPDIVDEAAAFIHNEPRVLKKITPLANFGSTLPGVVDVVVRTIERTGQLESRAVQIEATAQQHQRVLTDAEQRLRAEIGNTNALLGDVDTRNNQAQDGLRICTGRFNYVRACTCTETFISHIARSIFGEENDFTFGTKFSYLTRGLNAIDLWEPDVQQCKAWFPVPRFFYGFLAVASLPNVLWISNFANCHTDEVAPLREVVHDENTNAVHAGSPP